MTAARSSTQPRVSPALPTGGRFAAAVARHASSHYVPDGYRIGPTNGDDGIVQFAGAGAGFAPSGGSPG